MKTKIFGLIIKYIQYTLKTIKVLCIERKIEFIPDTVLYSSNIMIRAPYFIVLISLGVSTNKV